MRDVHITRVFLVLAILAASLTPSRFAQAMPCPRASAGERTLGRDLFPIFESAGTLAGPMQSFVEPRFVQVPRQVIYGQTGIGGASRDVVVETTPWTRQDQAEIEGVEAFVPACIRAASAVEQYRRTASGFSEPFSGIMQVVASGGSSYGEDGTTRGPNGFNMILFNDKFFPDLGMQMNGEEHFRWWVADDVCGYEEDVGPIGSGSFGISLPRAASSLQQVTRARYLTHEFLHGVVLAQMAAMERGGGGGGSDFVQPRIGKTDPFSLYRWFKGVDGPPVARYNALRAALAGRKMADGTSWAEVLAKGERTMEDLYSKMISEAETPGALAQWAEHRRQLCDLKRARSSALNELGFPARWINDTHAYDSSEEYFVIAAEMAIFDPPGFAAEYSPAERDFIIGWWQETFHAPLGRCPPDLGTTRRGVRQ